MTCLRPAKISMSISASLLDRENGADFDALDTTVHIRCKVINIGKTSLLLHASIVSPDGKHIFNTMEHNKVNVVLRKDPPSDKL